MFHYLPSYTLVDGVRQQAACGQYILPSQHSTEPSCEQCLDYLTSERAADPVDFLIEQETKADHSKAKSRGERVSLLAQSIASELHASGMLRGAECDARVRIQVILADDLYGNAAVDLAGVRS